MNLSEYFSEEFKNQYANDKIDLGTTLIVEIPHFNIAHKKFAIIIGLEGEDVAMVIINSDINPNIFTTPYLVSQLVNIPMEGHEDFLSKDSHIDCTKLQYKSKQEVLDYIKTNPSKVFNVKEGVCKKINEMITYSKLISNYEKKRFGFA